MYSVYNCFDILFNYLHVWPFWILSWIRLGYRREIFGLIFLAGHWESNVCLLRLVDCYWSTQWILIYYGKIICIWYFFDAMIYKGLKYVWVDCSSMVWEIGVQSKVDSYQRLKNGTWYRMASIQHYKVKIKGKVEQSREWSNALPYTSV